MKPPFSISWELVTPDLAKNWLKANTHNRGVKKHTVTAYADDMASGSWSPNHQGIAFGVDGKLMDGQHRLFAVVQSGASVPMLVCRDVPAIIEGCNSRVMDTVDRGKARSIPDLLKLEHNIAESANRVAAACMVIFALCNENPDRRGKLTMSQTLSIVEIYREELSQVIRTLPGVSKLRGAVLLASVAFAAKSEPVWAMKFWAAIGTGAGLDEGHPALLVRNQFLTLDNHQGSQSARKDRAEKVLHAIRMMMMGEKLVRMPSVTPGADWFRSRQQEHVVSIATLAKANAQPIRNVRTIDRSEMLKLVAEHGAAGAKEIMATRNLVMA